MFDQNISRKNEMQNLDLQNQAYSELPGPVFSHIELSINGLCNRSCHFCPRSNPSQYPSRNEYLEINLWEKLLSELKDQSYTGRLSFSGFSEPLLHPDLAKMISLSKTYLPSSIIEIVSNGDLLTSEIAKSCFEAGLDKLLVSMYDGDHQIFHFDQIFANACVSKDKYILRKRYLGEDEQFGLTFSNRAGSVSPIDAKELPLKSKCFYTHYRMMIDHNGDVLLCPHDWKSKIIAGNINDQNIYSIWYGEKLSFVRNRLGKADRTFEPCASCDVDGTLQGKAHYQAWQQK